MNAGTKKLQIFQIFDGSVRYQLYILEEQRLALSSVVQNIVHHLGLCFDMGMETPSGINHTGVVDRL